MVDDPQDPTKTVAEPVPPIKVAIVGTGDGSLPKAVVATTPGSAPNVVLLFTAPIIAILVRAANTFFVTLSGLLGAAGVGDVTGAKVFIPLTALSLKQMAIMSLMVVFVGFVKDCATVFGKLESKYPLLTGSV